MSRVNYLTTAQNFALEAACAVLNDAGFGAYLVGSCMERADYRDVDLRCILSDEHFATLFGAKRVQLRLINAALSEWISARTGLPIDFQFQSQSEADKYRDRPRNPMGILIESERAQDRRDANVAYQTLCPHDGGRTTSPTGIVCDDCGKALTLEDLRRSGTLAPRREHSRKPDGIREEIVAQVDGPYLELFARTQPEGWDVWGNQTERFGAAA